MNAPTLPPLDRDALARHVRALPSLPVVVHELLAQLQARDVDLDRIGTTLSQDQALSARVLQLANSPLYGLSGRIDHIRDGIRILGLRQLGTLVMAAAVTLQFERLHGQSLHMDTFWRHSIACAVAAHHLAARRGLDEGAAFTAGLLHDVGRLVVDSLYPQEMAAVLAWGQAHDVALCEAEQALLGIDHTAVGQWVCRHWRFSPAVVEAIAEHHHPPPSGPVSLIDVVHVADAMAHGLDVAGSPHEAVPAINPWAWQRLQLAEDDVVALLRAVEQEFRALQSSLSTPPEAP